MQSSLNSRQAPRIILRKAIDAQFDGTPALVLELGLGGAKFEHGQRVDIGSQGMLVCDSLIARAVVRHSILLPTERSVVYHTGVSFTELDPMQRDQCFKLLIAEAQVQVKEWEANLVGVGWSPSVIRRSAVACRFIALHLTPNGWRQTTSSDPNQPHDGVTVTDDTPNEEIVTLRSTYQNGDDTTRELLRRMATLAILERLHQRR
jgi:hypothetical protein